MDTQFAALKTEYMVAKIISEQAKHGCNFDKRAASWAVHRLNEKIALIDIKLIPLLPKMRVEGTSYKKPFKLNGQFTVHVQKYADGCGLKREDVGGPFTAITYTDFDPGKDQRVKEALMNYGWLPDEWNSKKVAWDSFAVSRHARKCKTFKELHKSMMASKDAESMEMIVAELEVFIAKRFTDRTVNYMKAWLHGLGFNTKKKAPTFDAIKLAFAKQKVRLTGPKISKNEDADDDEDFDLDHLQQDLGPVGNMLKDRVVYAHRRGLINGLLKVMRPDGRISGEANSCATPTFRFKHKKIVNIPAVGAFFGEECRSLFMSDYSTDGVPMLIRNEIPANTEKLSYKVREGTNIIVEIDKKGNEEKVGHLNYFIPAGRMVFVGYDGSGLELRMLAHYLIKECSDMLREGQLQQNANMVARAEAGLASALTYREVLLNADIHTHNQKLAGLPTRKAAKSFNKIGDVKLF